MAIASSLFLFAVDSLFFSVTEEPEEMPAALPAFYYRWLDALALGIKTKQEARDDILGRTRDSQGVSREESVFGFVDFASLLSPPNIW